MRSFINYLKEVRLELFKVVWPKKDEIIRLTLIVFIFSGIVALWVGGLDYAFTKLLEKIIRQ